MNLLATDGAIIDLYAQWVPVEMTGTSDAHNADVNGDGFGDNITFSVTSSVTLAVKPDGSLVCPTNAAIENLGDFAIHASSARILPTSPYSLAPDTAPDDAPDAICLLYGAGGTASLPATDYSQKSALPSDPSWNIPPSSSLPISLAGRVSHLTQDATGTPAEFATMQWWVTPGLIPDDDP